jgi:hypothetical protein
MNLRFTQYLDILFIAPALIVIIATICFICCWIGFSVYDYIERHR